MAAEDEVRKASERFYAALNRLINGDVRPLSDVWSHSATVTAMSPLGGWVVGWDKVRQSCEEIAQLSSEGQVKLEGQVIQVDTDVAYEIGVEHGQAVLAGKKVTVELRVTNIYRRESDGWKIVHRHSDISKVMQDALGDFSNFLSF